MKKRTKTCYEVKKSTVDTFRDCYPLMQLETVQYWKHMFPEVLASLSTNKKGRLTSIISTAFGSPTSLGRRCVP